MSFVCTLRDDKCQIDVIQREDAYTVIIPIGFDDEDDAIYSLWILLGPRAGGELELSFFVYVEDGDGNERDQIWDSYRARYLFSRRERTLMMTHLLCAVIAMLEAANPEIVFICSTDLDIAEKALGKYEAIARAFAACGYDVGKFDRYESQCVWRMERKANMKR